MVLETTVLPLNYAPMKNQKDLLDQDVQNTVLSVEGVLNIFNFTSSVSGRRYVCQFDVFTTYSTETLAITFEGI